MARTLLDDVLERVSGNFHISIGVNGKEAVRLTFEEKDVVVEIKNPVVAAELAIEGSMISDRLKMVEKYLKKGGRNVKVKYGPLEFRL